MEPTPFDEFLTQLFTQGKIVFRSAVAPRDRPSDAAMATLAAAFETHSLDLAGPRIAFDSEIACAAALLLRQASWALVSHDERINELEKRLKMPRSPGSPSEHLSADLSLRYLPQVVRRARALNPSDPLIERLAGVLRQWPLSGVLSDVEEPPTCPLDFGRHPGLLVLYAERLGGNDRPAWRPDLSSPAWEYHELVNQGRLLR
jgi:hypothetical protein